MTMEEFSCNGEGQSIMSGVEHFHSPAIFHLTGVMVEQGNIVATVCKTKLNGSAKYIDLSTITGISAVQFG
jgi:hypothetical protein